MLVPISDITKGSRIRKERDPAKFNELKTSLSRIGLLQPILVRRLEDEKYELVAGERRLDAVTELYKEGKEVPGMLVGQIEAKVIEKTSQRIKLLMEFGENNEREDFSPMERAKFIREFHDVLQNEYGKDNWTQELTARTLNLSPASISLYLNIEEAAKTDKSIEKAQTLRSAVKRMKVTSETKERIEKAKEGGTDVIQRAEAILANADAVQWIKGIENESVDLINFDPPWGDEASHKVQDNHEGFDDSTEYANQLVEDLFPELFRVLKPNRFMIFWFRYQQWDDMKFVQNIIDFHGFNQKHTGTPCFWYKPDKVSDENRYPEKQLISSYEPFLLVRKGEPLLHVRGMQDVFAYNRVPKADLIHPTEKPIALATDLIKLTTVPGEVVLDPTAGSSVFADAAIRNMRKAKACELSKNYYDRGIARLAEYLKTYKDK